MFCPECGSSVGTSARFCSLCGASLEQNTSSQVVPAAPNPTTTAQRAAAVYGASSSHSTRKAPPGKSETKRGLLGFAAVIGGVLLLIAVIVGALNANNTPSLPAVQARSEQTASMKTLGPLRRGEVLPLLRATDALMVSSNPDGHTAYVTVPGTPAKGTADADRIISGRLSDGRWVVFIPLASGSANVGDVYSLMWVWIDGRAEFVGEIPAENGGLGKLSTSIRNGAINISWPVCCPRTTRTKILALDGIRLRMLSDSAILKGTPITKERTFTSRPTESSIMQALDLGDTAVVGSKPLPCFDSPAAIEPFLTSVVAGDKTGEEQSLRHAVIASPGDHILMIDASMSPFAIGAVRVRLTSGANEDEACWLEGDLNMNALSDHVAKQ